MAQFLVGRILCVRCLAAGMKSASDGAEDSDIWSVASDTSLTILSPERKKMQAGAAEEQIQEEAEEKTQSGEAEDKIPAERGRGEAPIRRGPGKAKRTRTQLKGPTKRPKKEAVDEEARETVEAEHKMQVEEAEEATEPVEEGTSAVQARSSKKAKGKVSGQATEKGKVKKNAKGGLKKKAKAGSKKKKGSKKKAKAGSNRAVSAQDVFPEFKDSPSCWKCKRHVDPLKMRLLGKSQGIWQCRTCGVRYTQLQRSWGGWPPQEWESLSEADKDRFWQDMAQATTAETRDEVVFQSLANRIIESRIAGEKGEYQPLSWYQKRYSPEDCRAIEDLCKDVQEHPIFGKTYRVDICYQDRKKERQRTRE